MSTSPVYLEQVENIILLALVCYGTDNWVPENDLSQIVFDAGLPGIPPLTTCEDWAKAAVGSVSSSRSRTNEAASCGTSDGAAHGGCIQRRFG